VRKPAPAIGRQLIRYGGSEGDTPSPPISCSRRITGLGPAVRGPSPAQRRTNLGKSEHRWSSGKGDPCEGIRFPPSQRRGVVVLARIPSASKTVVGWPAESSPTSPTGNNTIARWPDAWYRHHLDGQGASMMRHGCFAPGSTILRGSQPDRRPRPFLWRQTTAVFEAAVDERIAFASQAEPSPAIAGSSGGHWPGKWPWSSPDSFRARDG